MTVTESIDGRDFAPQVDITQAADPHVQALAAENAQLRAERDRLESINARLKKKLAATRNSLVGLAQHIDGE